jgi:hypothetical protein
MAAFRRFLRLGLLFAPSLLFGPTAGADTPGEALTFERHVRPILKRHCFHCHGEEGKPKGKLDLRLVRSMVQGGTLGEAVVPGQHEDSLLWGRIDSGEMPPIEKKLSAREKAIIADWIDQGAKTARPEPESLSEAAAPTEEEKAFWSFQPIRRPDVPPVGGSQLVRSPIDAFLLQALEAKGLTFSPEADRRTLIRRATFDLTGLPPSPAEVDAFLADSSPTAFERLIDRLLDSPHYGERWARHWLDVAGYADSDGYTAKDQERKYAYRYRDYLVRALNADRPWDELIREQLAGDEMLAPPYTDLDPGGLDRLVATGFLRMAPDGTGDSEIDQPTARNDVIAETIKVVSTSLLGLTIGCAQCHSHRYDPIPHTDYYRFRALFEPAFDTTKWRAPAARLVSLWSDDDRKRAAEVDAEIAQISKERQGKLEELVESVLSRELEAAPEELRGPLREARGAAKGKRTAEQEQLLKDYPRVNVTVGNVSLYDAKAHKAVVDEFDKKAAAVKARRPAEDYVMPLTEAPGPAPATHLFFRGDIRQPRQEVEPGELSVLPAEATIPADDPSVPTTGRRLAYARHLTSGRHPLVARVLVNRAWHHHFGRGIVGTPGDFGSLGERPSHPELLDWLADEFMRGGWSLKRLHRLIVCSAAYRQSSVRTPESEAVDPENRLLGRMSVRRLEAEAVRDAILAASGRLNGKMFGPAAPVTPDESGQVIVGLDNRDSAGRPAGKRASLGGEEFRRSLYVQVRRSLPLNLLEAFDAPAMTPNCDRRTASTVAPQSLMLMNNEFVLRQSEAFADRVEREAGPDPASQVRLAWSLALSGEPDSAQVEAAAAFLEQQRSDFEGAGAEEGQTGPKEGPPPAHRRALATFCQALLSSNAFLYVD